jgi:hypothetical protein
MLSQYITKCKYTLKIIQMIAKLDEVHIVTEAFLVFQVHLG